MNDDDLLRRMFEAQRKLDEELAPSFEDVEAKTPAVRQIAPAAADGQSTSLLARVALSAVALVLVVGLTSWIRAPRPEGPTLTSASSADMQRLNQTCDSLLVTINALDSATMTDADAVGQEMVWRTGTDSMLPFETLRFDVETLP